MNGFVSGPNIISIIVTIGFFSTLFMMLFRPLAIGTNELAWQIINIMVGSLGTAFASVVHYQIGSTRTSQAKDETIKAQAETIEKKT